MHVWTCMCRSGEVGLYVTLRSFYLYGVGGRQRDMPFRSTTAAGWMQPEQEWKSAGVEFSSGRPCRAARLTQHTPRALIRSLYRHRCKVRPSVYLLLQLLTLESVHTYTSPVAIRRAQTKTSTCTNQWGPPADATAAEFLTANWTSIFYMDTRNTYHGNVFIKSQI